VRTTPFVLGRWRRKKKSGLSRIKLPRLLGKTPSLTVPSDPFANETSQYFRPCTLPFAHWFLLGLFLTRVSQVRMCVPFMAGLGLFFHKSTLALAPRGLLRSAYDFLCLIYAKSARASWKVPRPELHAKNAFWAPQRGFGDTILYTKT
jgi:hypothetical protein